MTAKGTFELGLIVFLMFVFTALFIIQTKEMCEDIKSGVQKINWRNVLSVINGPTLQEIFLQMEVVNNFLLLRLARLGVSRSEVDGFSFEQTMNHYRHRIELLQCIGRAVANLNKDLKKKGKIKARIIFLGLLSMTNEQMLYSLHGYATQGCLPDVPLYD